jgi:hypothetical protein
MTDEEIAWNESVLEEFREAGWRPPTRRDDETWNPRENLPDAYMFIPPRWAWDTTPDHPPITSVPCLECGEASEPYCRFEFRRYEASDFLPVDPHKRRGDPWKVGISLFAYECVEHGLFINQAIERKRQRLLNGQASVS